MSITEDFGHIAMRLKEIAQEKHAAIMASNPDEQQHDWTGLTFTAVEEIYVA